MNANILAIANAHYDASTSMDELVCERELALFDAAHYARTEGTESESFVRENEKAAGAGVAMGWVDPYKHHAYWTAQSEAHREYREAIKESRHTRH